ncbi:MAG: hypothetical protein QG620_148 [Patescibacteria group bacterium]|nr:hypothetical protein [Patescibacteria group bacterium]
MFENKNFSFGKKSSPAAIPSSSGIDASAPIYTMEKDLASLETSTADLPQNKKISFQDLSRETKLDKKEPTSAPEKNYVPSPFLAASAPASAPAEKKFAPTLPGNNLSNNIPVKTPVKKEAYTQNITAHPSIKITKTASIWGKTIHISVTIFIILLLASGGYYYFLNYGANLSGFEKITNLLKSVMPGENPPAADKNNPIEPVGETAEETEEIVPKNILFSIENPNYLNVNQEDLTANKAKEILLQQGKKIKEQSISTPVEFIVSDKSNNPIGFKVFSAALGINLSQTTLSGLGEDFSLFLYNENGITKLGLSITSIEDKELEKSILAEEKNLARAIEPLFLSNNYTIIDKDFSSSSHGDAKIRFINIVSPEDLSIDWTVYKGKLMIGTTRMTLRSIIDYTAKTNNSSLLENSEQTVDNL